MKTGNTNSVINPVFSQNQKFVKTRINHCKAYMKLVTHHRKKYDVSYLILKILHIFGCTQKDYWRILGKLGVAFFFFSSSLLHKNIFQIRLCVLG